MVEEGFLCSSYHFRKLRVLDIFSKGKEGKKPNCSKYSRHLQSRWVFWVGLGILFSQKFDVDVCVRTFEMSHFQNGVASNEDCRKEFEVGAKNVTSIAVSKIKSELQKLKNR